MHGYVLHDFAKADEDWLSKLLYGFSDGLPKLIAGDDAGFQNAVALRTNPPRPSSGSKAPHAARAASKAQKAAREKTEKALEKVSEDNPLARLLAKFRK